MDINVKVNPVYVDHLNKPQFTQIFYGGASSGKSYFISQKIVLDNVQGANWLVCRNVARTIRNSTYNEIVKAISNMGLAKYYSINKSDMVITNHFNGKQIIFAGLDDAEKIKSVTPANGVLERVFVEEATECSRNAIKQLEKRLRGISKVSKQIILAFNPILKSHFIYKDYFAGWEDNKNLYEDQDLCILKTTYRDNMFLTSEDRRLLENEKDPYWRSVYVEGNWGMLGNVVFKNWRVEDLSAQIPPFDNIFYGCDFGYSADPNAIVKLHLDKKRKRIYILDEWYQCGMSDEELLRVCQTFVGNHYVTCDSAEPKTIDYLAGNGIRAVPAVKGADSILRGIRWLQGYEIIVNVICQNFKNELEQYHWEETKDGIPMAKPVDSENHLIDATRYALCNQILAAEVGARSRL